MLRMISTILSTLEKLRQQQVVQSCVTAKRQLQILAPAASSHKMPAEQWRSGSLLFERILVAGFWRVVWTSQQWKHTKCRHIQNILRNMRLNVSKKRNKIRRSFKKCKRQSTAEPSTAVALCTAMSYILARGIVHLDTNDTKIIGPDNPTC